MTKIEIGDEVRHASGWTDVVQDIEGEVWGNRVIYLGGRPHGWLDCVFTKIETPAGKKS